LPGLLRSIAFHSWFTKVSLLAVVSITLPIANITNTSIANAAPNPIEIISITESSITSVEILFSSNVPKKQLSYYVINAAIELPVAAPQNSKTQNVATTAPKNIKKVVKTKATGLITAEIKNLNPKAAYNFSISAKTNKGKMISSAPVEYSPLSNLMDLLSNLPADWGNPKPIQLPTPAPTAAPVAIPAFTLSSSTETRTVNTAATGFTINSTGGAIASFAINATPPGMSFNTTTGALTGTPNTVAAATNYTITATNASGNVTRTFTLTVTAVVYTVGQTGPSGGKVFYVATTPFSCGPTRATTCSYLEAAPNGWQGAGATNDQSPDTNRTWSPVGQRSDVITSEEGIGWGYKHSITIAALAGSNTTNSAATLARSYSVVVGSTVYNDWFLPSKDELNEMYIQRTIIGLSPASYFSSTDNTNIDNITRAAYSQSMVNGAVIPDAFKYYSDYVRPIRAF
jgi:hypothetical protein